MTVTEGAVLMEIRWDNKFEVGIPRIDHEHQVFVDLIQNISEANQQAENRERISRLLTEIHKYADFQFFSEENLMLDVGFPEYRHHCQEHATLLALLNDKIYIYRNGEISLEQVVEFLFEWFALHTTQSDQKIARFIRAERQSA